MRVDAEVTEGRSLVWPLSAAGLTGALLLALAAQTEVATATYVGVSVVLTALAFLTLARGAAAARRGRRRVGADARGLSVDGELKPELRRRGVHRSLAAGLVLVGGLVVVFGGLGIIVQTFIAQFDSLSEQVAGGVNEIRDWLSRGPLHVSKEQVDAAINGIGAQVTANRGALTSGALTTATTLGEVLTGFFVVLFTLFFFLRDGGQIWEFLCRLLPRSARLPAARAGHYSWFTLVSYVRATVLVAFVDAVGIGIGLAILRIPLALPLAALVFLGAFIPVVGATLSGAVAVLVALVTKDPLHALLVLAIVIAVQQLEGHVLQPLIMGRAVSLHPLAVILAITTGVVAAGIVGGLVAVPLLAVGNTAVRYLAAHPDGEPTPDKEPPGTQPAEESDGGPIASEPASGPDGATPPGEDLPDPETSGSTSAHG